MDAPLRKLAAAVVALSVVVLLLVATENTIGPGVNDAGSGIDDSADCIGSGVQDGQSLEQCDEKIPSVGQADDTSGDGDQ